MNKDLKGIIKDKLEAKWLPEQIIRRYFKGELSFKTIYNWFLVVSPQVLRRKGKTLKSKEKRGKFNIGTSSKRRKIVKKHVKFGHWKLDTIVSSRGRNENTCIFCN